MRHCNLQPPKRLDLFPRMHTALPLFGRGANYPKQAGLIDPQVRHNRAPKLPISLLHYSIQDHCRLSRSMLKGHRLFPGSRIVPSCYPGWGSVSDLGGFRGQFC